VEGRLPDPGDALTGVEMFSGLEPDVRQRVIQAAVPRTYRKGQLLFVENDPGESLIVLKRGAVMVFRDVTEGNVSLRTALGHALTREPGLPPPVRAILTEVGLIVSLALPSGPDRLELAYYLVLQNPSRFDVLETFSPQDIGEMAAGMLGDTPPEPNAAASLLSTGGAALPNFVVGPVMVLVFAAWIVYENRRLLEYSARHVLGRAPTEEPPPQPGMTGRSET